VCVGRGALPFHPPGRMLTPSLFGQAGTTIAPRSDSTESSGAFWPMVFGNQDVIAQRSAPGLVSTRANRHTVEHVAAAPAAKPMHPSPSARQFRLLLNGLAPSQLRRMFCSDERACVRFGSWRIPRAG
jgi:hypothetical protein